MSADAGPARLLEPPDAIAMRRASAKIVLLDEHYGIAFAQNGAKQLLSRLLQIPEASIDRFPLPIELAIAEAIRKACPGEDVVIEPVPSLMIRIAKLDGGGESIVALAIEPKVRRQSLHNAVQRFKLTRRETDVLTLILRGKSSFEIGDELSIAETTVADYVKRLLRKTFSKNRAEMLAKIFDWQSDQIT